MLLGAPGITTRNKKLLVAPGITTRSKDAISLEAIASSFKQFFMVFCSLGHFSSVSGLNLKCQTPSASNMFCMKGRPSCILKQAKPGLGGRMLQSWTLLGAPGIATRSKDATRSKGHFY